VVAVVAAPGGDFSKSTHGAAHHTTARGLASRVIPAPDGSTTVPLEVPEGYATYTWQRKEAPPL
jgi:hypothetical protein